MDGADEVVVVPALYHLGDTAPHLRRGLVGEGEAEDVGGVDAQDVDDVGVTVGERLGLARTGTRDDADAAFGRFHGLPLAGVETFEDICHLVWRNVLYKINKKRLPGAKIIPACAKPMR